ncbi:MAG TPA: LysM peptidoglycan-binding domain-containing protein [Bacteroidia bacterium]|nr:LysM peptidoglycan-binding domain-containing protein [Bacteroidia bacterium]
MKFKLILFFAFFLLKGSHSDAFNKILPDSAKVKWIKGEKYLLHTVQPKETWNSVSQKYNLRISELMNANLGVIDLKIGQILNVPVVNSLQASNKKAKENPPGLINESKDKTAIEYTVRAGETLFSISKKFGSTVDEVKKWNNLPDNIVQKGQKLIVSYISEKDKPGTDPESKSDPKDNPGKIAEIKNSKPENLESAEAVMAKKNNDVALQETTGKKETVEISAVDSHETKTVFPVKNLEKDENPTRSMIPVGKGNEGKTIVQVSESGVCSWITDADVNQNKYYGLHRSAPIGTILKVTNKMNDKYVFVKIVGVLPGTGENEKSIIKISQAAVNKLGALDAHFQVELSYGILQ